MKTYKYLIIGGGMSADSAVKGIRELDKDGTIGMLCKEPHPPYDRPPLSKALWKGEKEEIIWRKINEHNADIHLSTIAKSLDAEKKKVRDYKGEEYVYEKLLIATGGKVNMFPYNVEGIIYYRTYSDYKKVKELSEKIETFTIIGGGFIGSEVAAALAMNNKKVTMIFPEKGVGARVYPSKLSSFITNYYKEKGVTVLSGEGITSIEKEGNKFVIKTDKGKIIESECVIAGLGIKPEVELALGAEIKVDNGIVVDEYMQTSHPDIYAAGDVANYFDHTLEKRRRVEHENNSNLMGEIAGKNMAGAKEKYTVTPFFYSDLFELGYEAVGELDSSYETVEQWKEPYREGVIYYLKNNRVKGVLLWNTWNQVDNARALLAEKGTFNKENVVNKLPIPLAPNP